MSENPDNTQAGSEAPKRFGSRRLVVGAIALAVVVAVALPVVSTLNPNYYGRYPQMRERMQNWRHSTHAKMSCISCHMDPGVKGFVVFSARAIPSFYSQLIFGPKKTNLLSVPSIQACQKCHTGYRQVSPNGDLLIPHRAHVEVLKIRCAVCHKGLVHVANAQGFNRPKMTTCLSLCHNGVNATNKCVKCHTRKNAPPSHKRADWLEVHSQMTETVNCAQCHQWSPNYCADCHKKRPRTHVGNWKTLHQVRARERGKGCVFCHGESFCRKCHD